MSASGVNCFLLRCFLWGTKRWKSLGFVLPIGLATVWEVTDLLPYTPHLVPSDSTLLGPLRLTGDLQKRTTWCGCHFTQISYTVAQVSRCQQWSRCGLTCSTATPLPRTHPSKDAVLGFRVLITLFFKTRLYTATHYNMNTQNKIKESFKIRAWMLICGVFWQHLDINCYLLRKQRLSLELIQVVTL